MSKMEFIGALEVKKLTKQKWEQYQGTPFIYYDLSLKKLAWEGAGWHNHFTLK